MRKHRLSFWRFHSISLLCVSSLIVSATAQELPRGVVVSQAQPGVTSVAADTGNWGGDSMGITHQNQDQYWSEKTLFIPNGALDGVREARLRVYMALFDNSVTDARIKPNGLDESFVFTVNGKPHQVNDNDPALPSEAPTKWRWHEFTIPVSELQTGKNVFVFHKNHSEKNDDFLYIGIDNSTSYGLSRMSQDGGKTWTDSELNTLKASGEYMVQLLLLKESPQRSVVWTPETTALPSPIGYVGLETDREKPYLRIELDPYVIDYKQPLKATLQTGAGVAPTVRWINQNDKEMPVESHFEDGTLTATLMPTRDSLSRVEIEAEAGGKPAVSRVRFDYSLPVGSGAERRVNMAPLVAAAKGKSANRAPRARLTAAGFVLENATQVATFAIRPALRLTALYNEFLRKNVLAYPEQTHLFLTEIDGKRYGAEDWQVQNVKAVSPTAIQVALALPNPALTARFTVSIDRQALKFGLDIANASKNALTWKTAFPQLGGLQLSPDENRDYYLFPLWGGAIAAQNVNLRTIYGDDNAWWQMTSVFSPEGGSGLLLRCLDEKGLYKGIALRKGRDSSVGGAFIRGVNNSGIELDQSWYNSLESGPGTSTTFEYLKHTREAGAHFTPPDAALEMYEGDWHSAMQAYAAWAHKVWKWRPWPSKLRDRWNIISPGWGQKPLFADGKWRTDYIDKKSDIAELMSWWQWSKKGPWQVPMDQLKEKLGEALYNGAKNYWVINPATGELEYPLNRGDYEYNTDWGGLPALKKTLQAIRDGGQMPWFYTDPFLADDNTELGHKYGPQYGIMNPRYTDIYHVPLDPPGYVTNYASWNICMDTKWYQDFLVDQMTRIVRDTGIDGIRFDEVGRASFACSNPRHQHMFSEPGQNAGLQAATSICRAVHESVDKIKPDFVLTTEFLGYDRLATTLEGSVNYESARYTFEGFRPVPLNVFRFYFPEHKHYDLDDATKPHGQEWRFWNASGAFDNLHPTRYFLILKENSDTFDTREATPLIPTLVENVYANRFTGGGKTITLLYNARGYTVDRPLLNAPPKTGYHYFDLLNGREIAPQNNLITMKLRPDQVAAIAQLPKVLSVQKTANGWQITLSRNVPDASIVFCNGNGEELRRETIQGMKAVFPDSPPNEAAVYVKLFAGKYLVDAHALTLVK